jgi:hypothetical protein
MKNKFLTLLSILLISFNLFAQDNYGKSYSGFDDLNEAGQIAKQIVSASGQKANFGIMEANVPNAVAVLKEGKRYILYNPDFIDKITRITGTKWAAVSVLAHEIGHHLYPGSERKAKYGLASEIEADEFSGFVLQRMGASLDDAEAAMKLLATSRATSTHPAGEDRLGAIAAGWNKADEGENVNEHPYVVQSTASNTTSSATPSSIIAATISLNSSPGVTYYVTKKLDVVKASPDRVQLVAHVARSTSRAFPFIIYDDDGTRLYVDRFGNIVDADGELMGKMKAYSS